jgi:hypothetical protein
MYRSSDYIQHTTHNNARNNLRYTDTPEEITKLP